MKINITVLGFLLLTSLLTILISLFTPKNAYALRPLPNVEVHNLSNTGYSEKWFTIYKKTVYWLDAYEGIIYGYNFTKQKNFPLFKNQPVLPNLFSIVAFDGRYLVYNTYDNVSYNVNVYDKKKNKNITVTEGAGSRWATDYENKVIVYRDGGACGKLYAYNLITSKHKLITAQMCGNTNISQRFIVWGYAVTNGSGVFGYDLKTDTKYDIATEPGYRSSPDIFKNKVIWSINNNENAEVYIYDLRTKEEKLLYTSPDYWISWPSISNQYAVWGKNTAQHVSGVEGIDLKTGNVFEIQEQGSHQNDNLTSIIDKNIVAWMSWRTGNGDIYGAILSRD